MQKNNIIFLNYQNNQNSQYLQNNKQKNNTKNLDRFYMYLAHIKNLSSTRTIYHNYIPSYAKDIKVKSYDGFYFAFFMFFYIIIFQFISVPFKLPLFIILISISLF